MAAVLSESVLDQNGPNDHFGQNDLTPNRILAFARPKWTKMVHFGPFRSANCTLAIPDLQSRNYLKQFEGGSLSVIYYLLPKQEVRSVILAVRTVIHFGDSNSLL